MTDKIIADRDMNPQDYQKATESKENIVDLLAISDSDMVIIEFEPNKLNRDIYQPANFE